MLSCSPHTHSTDSTNMASRLHSSSAMSGMLRGSQKSDPNVRSGRQSQSEWQITDTRHLQSQIHIHHGNRHWVPMGQTHGTHHPLSSLGHIILTLSTPEMVNSILTNGLVICQK